MWRFGIEHALWDEFNAIWGSQDAPPDDLDQEDQHSPTHLKRVLDGNMPEQSALCLSGGGVRSAAFCLGAVQGLAESGVLADFHYLSTVSGGGYIGGWLQAWLRRLGGNTSALQRELNQQPELPPVSNLRNYTSYLSPDLSLASLDTWAMATLIGRNILINWLIFLPALLAFALLPLGLREILDAASLAPDFTHGVQTISLMALFTTVCATCLLLPSHCGEITPPGAATPHRTPLAPVRSIKRWMVGSALLWSLLITIAAAPSVLLAPAVKAPSLVAPSWHAALNWGSRWYGNGLVFDVFLTLLAGYLMAAIAASFTGRGGRPFIRNFAPWVIASLGGCAGLAWGLRLGQNCPTWVLATLGPPWAIGTHLLMSPVFVMLRKVLARGEQDREWLARVSAAKLQPLLLWAIFAAVCLAPLDTQMIEFVEGRLGDPTRFAQIGSAITLLSGIVAALFGRSDRPLIRVGATGKGLLAASIAIALATAIFAIGLFGLLSLLGASLVTEADPWLPRWAGPFSVAAALYLLVRLLDLPINVNRFSMHGLYRNRLERAFLGSVRPIIGPDGPNGPPRGDADHPDGSRDPFTDFDGYDNLRMAELVSAVPARLFPVVNVALNLTNSEQTRRAWAERKAAPFTITPLASGSDSLPRGQGFVATGDYGASERETGSTDPARGISLGSAMTISGAAASPNMGYNSTPATAFLMTLFNVRLGAWLPNPAKARNQGDLSRKVNTLHALFSELLGQTDTTSAAINLSDGGHFENLGLYEMIRRGCRSIVVVDAAADPDYSFGALGNAVRKVQIDLGVEIKFDRLPMTSREKWGDDSRAWAVAKIIYPRAGGVVEGKLLYIKACLPPNVPADVWANARTDANFPHDSTADQFFNESRFESYRKLGKFLVEGLPQKNSATLQAFFAGLQCDIDFDIAPRIERELTE